MSPNEAGGDRQPLAPDEPSGAQGSRHSAATMPYINHSLSFRGISSGQSHWLLPLMQGELALDSVMTRFAEAGYEPDGDFWWAVAGKGKTRVRFIIEHV